MTRILLFCLVGSFAMAAGVNVRDPETGDTPLLAAVGDCDRAKIEALLKRGADFTLVDRFGETVLHRAIDRLRIGRSGPGIACRNEVIRRLAPLDHLKAKRDEQGRTPLDLVRYLQAHPVEWGNGVSRLTFREALKALR